MKMRKTIPLVCGILLIALTLFTTIPANPASADEGTGQNWALMVGVSEYREIDSVFDQAYNAKE